MEQPLYPMPREDLRDFLQSLSRITDLRMAYMPPGSDLEDLIIGESTFCLQVKASREGWLRCRNSIDAVRKRAARSRNVESDLCHARLAEMIIPLVSPRGQDLGTVLIGQSVAHPLTDEHREHVRRIGSDISPDGDDNLVAEMEKNPFYSRSRLQDLGGFIQQQLVEKMMAFGTLEETTQYLLEKYEELMFLYAVTENLTPETGHQRALSVILDKGAQKLNARWGVFLMLDGEDGRTMRLLDTWGNVPWAGEAGHGSRFPETVSLCRGPSLILGPGFGDLPLLPGTGDLLVVPFSLRNLRQAFLVFGWEDKGMLDDGGLRFALALSRQAAAVLSSVLLYQEMVDLLFATLGALSSAVDAKDPYTHGHSRRVAEYAVVAARAMNHDRRFITMIKVAGQLHDFGKIGIREYILSKEGRLTRSEKEAMEEHPVIGAQILKKFKAFAGIVPGIRHHHEHFDGSGYPDNLSGGDIPLVGRIIAVADAYDAMTTTRPYRTRMDHGQALLELRRNAGSQFDPAVVEAFVTAVERSGHEH